MKIVQNFLKFSVLNLLSIYNFIMVSEQNFWSDLRLLRFLDRFFHRSCSSTLLLFLFLFIADSIHFFVFWFDFSFQIWFLIQLIFDSCSSSPISDPIYEFLIRFVFFIVFFARISYLIRVLRFLDHFSFSISNFDFRSKFVSNFSYNLHRLCFRISISDPMFITIFFSSPIHFRFLDLLIFY